MVSRPTNSDVAVVKLTGSIVKDASTLNKKGLIRFPLAFTIYMKSKHIDIQEGYYSLTGTSLREIAEAIAAGPNTNRITFPEGFSAAQMAQRLNSYKMDGTGFYRAAKNEEGRLFPDTYFFDETASISEIVKKMTDDFESRTANISLTDEALIIASIVEREAKKDDERAKIAAVYFNRVKQNKDLEADPTVQYGRDLQLIASQGLDNVDLWQPLKSGEVKSISSAYNTYMNAGLPPGPICNPGIKSIQAAANPEPNFDKLFFFHDKNGLIHFSNSFEEHQELIKQFGL